MPQITAVEPQKRHLRRFNIYIDNKFAFGTDEDVVVKHRLILGKQIDPETLKKLIFEAEIGKLMEKMYRLFSFRMRSEKEVRDYFKLKNYQAKIKGRDLVSDEAVNILIDNLKDKGFLNDLQFAKIWVQARRRNKNQGKGALKVELFNKGINKEIIDEVLDEDGGISEETLALQALEKKTRSWKNLTESMIKKKAYGYLGRRGFDYQIIKDVVAKTLKKE